MAVQRSWPPALMDIARCVLIFTAISFTHMHIILFHACLLHLTHHEQVARELLVAGANIEAVEHKQWTALMFACQNGHSEVCVVFFAF